MLKIMHLRQLYRCCVTVIVVFDSGTICWMLQRVNFRKCFKRKLNTVNIWQLPANWSLTKVWLLFFSIITTIVTTWTRTSHLARLMVYLLALCLEESLTLSLSQMGVVCHPLWRKAGIQLQLQWTSAMTKYRAFESCTKQAVAPMVDLTTYSLRLSFTSC